MPELKDERISSMVGVGNWEMLLSGRDGGRGQGPATWLLGRMHAGKCCGLRETCISFSVGIE